MDPAMPCDNIAWMRKVLILIVYDLEGKESSWATEKTSTWLTYSGNYHSDYSFGVIGHPVAVDLSDIESILVKLFWNYYVVHQWYLKRNCQIDDQDWFIVELEVLKWSDSKAEERFHKIISL